jgi:hypothetical protein
LTTLPLAAAADKPVPKSVPGGLEGQSSGVSHCTTATTGNETTRLAVLADLLSNLPAAERRDIIASLSPADRVAIAKQIAGVTTE